jgi:hypothetical protein
MQLAVGATEERFHLAVEPRCSGFDLDVVDTGVEQVPAILDIRGLEAAYRLGHLCPWNKISVRSLESEETGPDMAFVPQWQRSKPRLRQVCALSLVEGGA